MVDNLELIKVDTADTLEELCEKEIRYIAEYNSYYMNGKGYNMTYGGEGANGYIYTEEDKQRMSLSQIEYHNTHPDAKYIRANKLKEWNKNNPDFAINKSTEMQKWHDNHPEFKETHSNYMKALHIERPELKENSSKRMKKIHEDDPELGIQKGRFLQNYWKENPEKLEIRKLNHSKKMKELLDTPEFRTHLLDVARKLNTIPTFVARDKNSNIVGTFDYIPDVEKKLFEGKRNSHIGECLKGTRKSSHGYTFKYIEPPTQPSSSPK